MNSTYLILPLLFLSACGQDPAKSVPVKEINASTAQEFCAGKGGQAVLFSPNGGYKNTISENQYGCLFTDSSGGKGVISSSTLYQYHKGQQQMAVSKFLNWSNPNTTGSGNPAAVNCSQLGGSSEVYSDASGGASAYCVFSDGSKIEEWTLFRGPSGCPKLFQVLQTR